ncbi:EAL domain-containing protein [Pseudarthrobacter sp. NPDC057230]|uniref:EAL domain-containing protein n=1 Tax=Pseudarthrobacter sp. NPDC057230 TaxID=3346057 RepID=UPI003636B420
MTAPTSHEGHAPLAAEPGTQQQPGKAGPVSLSGGRLLLTVLTVQAAFTLAVTAALHTLGLDLPDSSAAMIAGFISAALVLVAAGIRVSTKQGAHEKLIPRHIGAVLGAGQDWLWAVDSKGIFTYSSQASASLLGYDPSELLGKPLSTVLDDEDRASSRRDGVHVHNQHTGEWAGVVVAFRHRNGKSVWMEVTGKSRPGPAGSGQAFEGIGSLLPGQTVRTLLRRCSRERLDKTGRARPIVTAFQPVHNLSSGTVTGVEALARFPGDVSRSPEHWFTEATSAGLGCELDFAALEAALHDAVNLPPNLTVALNLSPETCLDPRLPKLVEEMGMAPDRIVLELTERQAVDDYASLNSALMPLRKRGLRVAVDDAGSGFSSMRHILELRPDIIKLDRSLITGMHTSPGQLALGAAMVKFAQDISATIVAEGIETEAELITARKLGFNAGQGYLLGRPTTRPIDWAAWHPSPAGISTGPIQL